MQMALQKLGSRNGGSGRPRRVCYNTNAWKIFCTRSRLAPYGQKQFRAAFGQVPTNPVTWVHRTMSGVIGTRIQSFHAKSSRTFQTPAQLSRFLLKVLSCCSACQPEPLPGCAHAGMDTSFSFFEMGECSPLRRSAQFGARCFASLVCNSCRRVFIMGSPQGLEDPTCKIPR